MNRIGNFFRIYLIGSCIFVFAGGTEKTIDEKNPFVNLALCEKISQSSNIRLPNHQLQACLRLTQIEINGKIKESRAASKILIKVVKKLFKKSLAVQHIDPNITLSLQHLIKSIILSNSHLLKAMKEDPMFEWVYEEASMDKTIL